MKETSLGCEGDGTTEEADEPFGDVTLAELLSTSEEQLFLFWICLLSRSCRSFRSIPPL